MGRKKKEQGKTLWEWRGYNWQVNYNLRQYFKMLPPEEQVKYHALSFAFGPWKLNRFGAIEMTYEQDSELAWTAVRQHLKDGWYLISFYTSEAGWEEYVRQFNALDPDESYPPEKFSADIVLSTAPVDK